MKNLVKQSTLFMMMALIAFTACKKKEDEPKTTSKPVVSASANALFLKPSETETITLTVSAAGKLKELTAVTSNGTIVLEKEGIGAVTASGTINYTAPAQEGTGMITVTATDEMNQITFIEISVEVTAIPPVIITGGDVEGTWETGNTYIIRGDIVIQAGKSLTIQEGVTVIVDGDGGQGSPEIVVKGNIYSLGSESQPVKFTIPENARTEANIFTGMWGGINCLSTTTEAVFEYTHIHYAGAPAGANSTTVDIGELDEGDNRYSIFFENENGKLIIKNCEIAYNPDDAIVLNGGQILVSNNVFMYTGRVGGEAMNVNSGVVGDIAFNVFYRCATNGVKWDNKGGKSPQTDCRIYNNTFVGCGWRQAKTDRGGSLNVQRDGRGYAYNNLIVNCKFGVRLRASEIPDDANVFVGYNFYYGKEQVMVDEFYPELGTLSAGDKETDNDITGDAGENDPKFVNHNVTTVTISGLESTTVSFMPNYNFKLQSDSPALDKGKTDFTPKIASLTVGGKTFTAPSPASYCGAMGN